MGRTTRTDMMVSDQIDFKKISKLLQDGGVVVMPTETRYGLLGRVDRPDVLERILRIKGRDRTKPMAIFLPDIAGISEYGVETDISRKLAEKFLPGPLTLVLKSTNRAGVLLAPAGKVGIRISSSLYIKSVLDQVGLPLCATSANISGRPEAENLDDIKAELGEAVDLYLDGGPLRGELSTVVDVSIEPPVILRSGAISEQQIRKCLNNE